MDLLIAKYLSKNTHLNVDELIKFYPNEDADTLSNRVKEIKRFRKQLKKLLAVPFVKQKSEEWHAMRKNLITASDFAQALGEGKFGTQKQLIEKKCHMGQDPPFKSNPFFDWGNMFEQVASDIYADIMHVKMYEFGLIGHPSISFFGASPDGISNLGIMLEIKCPFKRKITGEIPKQYYYQIQGQLEVCNLNECDYIECELSRWESYNDYKCFYTPGNYTGYIVQSEKNGEKHLIYSKVQKHICDIPVIANGQKVYYWQLNKHYIQRVYRDQNFIDTNLNKLGDVWKQIVTYRENPTEYMKYVKQSITLDTETLATTCPSVQLTSFQVVDLD